MSVRVEVRPSLFEWARARSGIGAETLAKRFPRYDDWLSGQATPTLKQLETFAHRTPTPLRLTLERIASICRWKTSTDIRCSGCSK